MNVIDACNEAGVKQVVALSTDKANSDQSLWRNKARIGQAFVASNPVNGGEGTRFAIVRYGNVMGSRGR